MSTSIKDMVTYEDKLRWLMEKHRADAKRFRDVAATFPAKSSKQAELLAMADEEESAAMGVGEALFEYTQMHG